MKYLDYQNCDSANGVGFRSVLWLSNCSWGCKGCFNKKSWGNRGEKVTEEFLNKIIKDLSKPFIDGFSWSGGDPLHKKNYKEVIEFSKEIKDKLPNKTIWMWTGYTFEQILQDEKRVDILAHIDYLVDGKFEIEYSKNPPPFRGSSNQRVIDVKESLAKGCVVKFIE